MTSGECADQTQLDCRSALVKTLILGYEKALRWLVAQPSAYKDHPPPQFSSSHILISTHCSSAKSNREPSSAPFMTVTLRVCVFVPVVSNLMGRKRSLQMREGFSFLHLLGAHI